MSKDVRVFNYAVQMVLPAKLDPEAVIEPLKGAIRPDLDVIELGVRLKQVFVVDGRTWYERALSHVDTLWSEIAEALTEYHAENLRLPSSLDELATYGDDPVNVERQIEEIYSISEDLLSADGFEQAAAIMESDDLFGDWKTLDPGVWNDPDPRESIKCIADGLYTRLIQQVCASRFNLLGELLNEFPFEDALPQVQDHIETV